MKIVAFDLEGPLSPNDNAYELNCSLIPGWRDVDGLVPLAYH